MPPKPGRPAKVSGSSSKKKGKRSHSEFAGDDDEYHDYAIDAEDVPFPFKLDGFEDLNQSPDQSINHSINESISQSTNRSSKPKKLHLSPLRSDFLASPSPNSGSFDQSINPSNFAFKAETPLLDSLTNDTNQSTNQSINHETLKSLAYELHALQKEAKERGLLVESELRNIYHQSINDSISQPTNQTLDSQPFYQTAITLLHGIDVSDDPLDDTQVPVSRLLDMTQQRRRKKNDASTNQSNHKSNNQSISDCEEERPRKQTEKQKAQSLKEMFDDIETYMSFPSEAENRVVRPVDDQSINQSIHIPPRGQDYRLSLLEQQWKAERESSHALNPSIDQSMNEKSKKKEKKKDKEKREKERQKEQKKFAEAQRLYLPYFDVKVRKDVVEWDQSINQSNKTLSSSTLLLNRLMACIIEQPESTNQPHRPYYTGPITSSSKPKKKKKLARANMTIDERLKMELRALGMPTLASVDVESALHDRVDDQICSSIRKHHNELIDVSTNLNSTRSLFYPLGCKITDHTQRLKGLLEAETALTKAIKKKKKGNDKTVHQAYDQFVTAEKRFGKRYQITGFIPDPREMGGMPREEAAKIRSHPGYVQVLMNTNLPPLGQSINQSINDYPSYSSYKTSYSPAPMGNMSTAYASPLPNFTSTTSPLRLPGSPRLDASTFQSQMTDDFGLNIGSISQSEADPFSFSM